MTIAQIIESSDDERTTEDNEEPEEDNNEGDETEEDEGDDNENKADPVKELVAELREERRAQRNKDAYQERKQREQAEDSAYQADLKSVRERENRFGAVVKKTKEEIAELRDTDEDGSNATKITAREARLAEASEKLGEAKTLRVVMEEEAKATSKKPAPLASHLESYLADNSDWIESEKPDDRDKQIVFAGFLQRVRNDKGREISAQELKGFDKYYANLTGKSSGEGKKGQPSAMTRNAKGGGGGKRGDATKADETRARTLAEKMPGFKEMSDEDKDKEVARLSKRFGRARREATS